MKYPMFSGGTAMPQVIMPTVFGGAVTVLVAANTPHVPSAHPPPSAREAATAPADEAPT